MKFMNNNFILILKNIIYYLFLYLISIILWIVIWITFFIWYIYRKITKLYFIYNL